VKRQLLPGDVLAAIRAQDAEAHLTVVAGARAQSLLSGDPRIQSLVNTAAFESPLGRLKLAVALWRHRPHVVVDLRHTLYPLLLNPLGFWRYLRQPPRTLAHMRDRQLWKLRMQAPSLRAALGAARRAAASPLWSSEKDVKHVDQLWQRWRLDQSERVVVISPGARSHIKRWLSEGFAEVADRLIRSARAHVVFVGEPAEEPIVLEITGLMRERALAHNAVGLTTIRQLAVLMQRAALVIANDSAALHVASAVNASTLAIFGPTDERKYGPTSSAHRVIRRRLFCTPCEAAQCRYSHECMRFVSAEEVFQAACQLLGARGTRHGAGESSSRAHA